MDTDHDDAYQRALENIQQIENEIMLMLESTKLNNDNDNCKSIELKHRKSHPNLSDIDLNSYCDSLLNDVNKGIVWTDSIIDEPIEHCNNNYNNNNCTDSIHTEFQSLNTAKFEQKHVQEQQRSHHFDNVQHSLVKKHSISNEDILSNDIGNDNNNNKNDDKRCWISDKNKHLSFNNGLSSDSSSLSTPNSTNELDKESNYRYSFYDNCNKLAVHLAHSSIFNDLNNEDSSTSTNIDHFAQLQVLNGGRILPDYIENALIYILKYGLNSVGIFRKSGVKSRINILKEKIQQNEEINFASTKESVYDVADLVKTWLRDLNPHLLTNDLIDLFVTSSKSKDRLMEQFHLWHLNDCHRYLLFIVLKFLSMISQYSSQNQMNVQNLAICFAPSLCDGDNEKQINRAQKCLQYCIENYESLFYIDSSSIGQLNIKRQLSISLINNHTSVIIINASPKDILDRLLYERNTIDKLIYRWSIIDNNDNDNQVLEHDHSDIFEFELNFSCLLPTKTFTVQRQWSNSTQQPGGFELNEIGELIKSNWIMVPNGKGQTLVKHEIYLELRGFSSKWYRTIYPLIHDQQLKCLQSSFQTTIPMNGVRISEV